jgi:hypothetical protein
VFGILAENEPSARVTRSTIVRQCAGPCRWIFTDTPLAQAMKPSVVVTNPEAVWAPLIESVTDRRWSTVNVVALEAEPPAVVTAIVPVVPPAGTRVEICVEESTAIGSDAVPLNLTAVTPEKPVPKTVTVSPTAPLVGLNDVMVGVTENFPLLVAVPSGVVTETVPVPASAGTVAVIFVEEFTVNGAEMPPNFTAVAPAKLLPSIVTEVPTGPFLGLNEPILGAPVTVKFDELVAVPDGVVTAIGPVVAPLGTVAVIFVPELTVKVADVPWNFTAVAPVKLVPSIVTEVPGAPLVGLNEVIFGLTVKFVELVAVPDGVVTVILPVVAPAGTAAVIFVAEFTVNDDAAVPLNFTAVAPERFAPLIVTAVPTGPLAGLNEPIVGAGASVTVNAVELVPVPSSVVTEMGPVVAPAGTSVDIRLLDLTENVAGVPLKVTAVAPARWSPWIVTAVPIGPLVGLKLERVGGGAACAAGTPMATTSTNATGHTQARGIGRCAASEVIADPPFGRSRPRTLRRIRSPSGSP